MDDLGWSDLECYGSPFYETPHIDALAANGVRFTQAYAGSTVCAVEGAVWITEENQARDIVLAQGACYRLRNRGLAVINPLGGMAAVELA